MRRAHPQGHLLLLFCAILIAGCLKEQRQTTEIDRSTPTPEELAAKIEHCAEEAEATCKLLEVRYAALRLRILQGHVNKGITAIGQLVADPNATVGQIQAAKCSQSKLYLYGAYKFPEFVEPFQVFVETEAAGDPNSEVSRLAQGRWLLFQYVAQDGSTDEAHDRIVEYASQFPEGEQSAQLFIGLCQRLIKKGDIASAVRSLDAGASILRDPQALDTVRSHIVNLQHTAQRKQSIAQADKVIESIVLTKLGGRTQGHFVFYSEEPKTRRCDYSRVKGLDGAVSYVKAATRKGWTWEFIQAYPETPAGYKASGNKVQRLYGGNTTLSFGS